MDRGQPSSYAFVTFSDVEEMRDASAKSIIRRHAMKDIGASRRGRPRRRKVVVELPNEALTAALKSYACPLSPGIRCGAVDPFCRFPVDLDYNGRALVANSMFCYQSYPYA